MIFFLMSVVCAVSASVAWGFSWDFFRDNDRSCKAGAILAYIRNQEKGGSEARAVDPVALISRLQAGLKRRGRNSGQMYRFERFTS